MTDIELYDEVKHKRTGTIGTVISIYSEPKIPEGKKSKNKTRSTLYLDIKLDNEHIYWRTPAENWEVISREKHLL